MKHFLRYAAPIALVLAIPAIPFLLFGEFMETEMPQRLHLWLRDKPSTAMVAATVVGLLTVDVLLPIPSSVVCSLVGSFLGLFGGIVFATLGLTAGALLGFALGKILGRPAMKRWIDETELLKLDQLAERFGVPILILLRPVPLFAEASTLLLGCSPMRFGTFLLVSFPVHLMLALVYVLIGQYLGVTVGVACSIFIALLLSWVARKILAPFAAR